MSTPEGIRFCDDTGMVSHNRHPRFDGTYIGFLNHLRQLSGHLPHEGGPFPCTGSVHLFAAGSGETRCGSPAHSRISAREILDRSSRRRMKEDGYALVRIAAELSGYLADAPVDDPDVASLLDDVATVRRIGNWLVSVEPLAIGTGTA